LPSSFLF
jgi:ubiquitin carboxyl-terminal hydrolase 10